MSRIKIVMAFVCLHSTYVYGTEVGDVSKSSKISSELRAKFLRNPILEGFDIMIEFGGNSKPIKEFKEIQRKLEKERSAPLPKGERVSLLVNQLEEHSASSQNDVIDLLKSQSVEYSILRVSNKIFVRKAGPELISEIAEKKQVAQIRSVIKLNLPQPVEVMETTAAGMKESTDGPEWNVYQVNARCKEISCLGDGVVVAIIDTGVLRSHVELRDNYRKEYGWFDPFDGTLEPNLNLGSGSYHGTYAAGVAVGKTKGVALNAKWVACRCLREDTSEELYHKLCGEWALCPWIGMDLSTRNCSMAPDVAVNNYGFVPTEQLTFQRRFFYPIVAAWNAAGILHAFTSGNEGPFCTTVRPPASYDISLAVGAVDSTSTAAFFSSRGPVLDMELDTGDSLHIGTCKHNCGGNGWGWKSDGEVCTLIKPDISAPGFNINSSYGDSDTSYKVLTRSSATAMVSGVLALMVCANKEIEAPYLDQMIATKFIKETAITYRINLENGHEYSPGNNYGRPNNFARISNILCNKGYGNICNGFPNNIYGYGEIDACAAVKKVKFLL